MVIGVGHWKCTDTERKLVRRVLNSGRLSYGPMCRKFESEFSTIHGNEFGVLSNSGTSSLQVALQAIKEEHGWNGEHEVIVPAITFVATINIILHNGMKPVLVDVDQSTYNMDTLRLEEAITDNTRCIIPVHLFGQMADMSEIEAIASDFNSQRDADDDRIRIISDSCESMFALHNSKPIGKYGDISCFSMYMAHILTTGVGGVATTDNPVYAERMRSLVNHGRDGVYISIDDGSNKEILDKRFSFVSVGHSFRITELEAALGLGQLENYKNNIFSRNMNAHTLTEFIHKKPDLARKIQTPSVMNGNTHSFMMYPIVLRDGDKWEMCKYLEDNGIETREMLPITTQPVYDFDEDDYPVAKWINENGFYVGCHPGLTVLDMKYIGEKISGYFYERQR